MTVKVKRYTSQEKTSKWHDKYSFDKIGGRCFIMLLLRIFLLHFLWLSDLSNPKNLSKCKGKQVFAIWLVGLFICSHVKLFSQLFLFNKRQISYQLENLYQFWTCSVSYIFFNLTLYFKVTHEHMGKCTPISSNFCRNFELQTEWNLILSMLHRAYFSLWLRYL